MANEKNKSFDENWFADILMSFAPSSVDIEGKTPDEMTSSASWKAFWISTGAAIPPGPLGLATILPELMAITKLQMNLIYKIAAYYHKQGKVNKTIVMLIFANQVGLALGKQVVKRIGRRVIIRALGSKAIRPIAQRIATKIGARLAQKAIGRWIPFVLAPIFGAFSKSMTTDIGREADKIFSQDIEVLDPIKCKNGHDANDGDKFCPECGISL